MPMRHAAQAARVSRAFLSSWRCHPNLAFSKETLGLNENACVNVKKSKYFASTVRHIMKNHSGIGVKTFRLDSRRTPMYNFPCSLLSDGGGESLRYLHLAGCNFHPTVRFGCLRSLTRLQLCAVCIAGDELECLLSSAFALERLALKHCSGIICLKIPCLQKLNHLEVLTCIGLHVVESKAPNLSSFCLAGDLDMELSILGTSRIRKYERFCSGTVFYARTELPSSMPNLETLTICSETETVDTPMVHSRFLHLKCLTIILGGQTYDVFSLVSFLYASPCLETFILNRISLLEDPPILRNVSEHHHSKLKQVEMIRFSSVKSLVELTCHILDSATCTVNKCGKCFPIRRDALVEAQRALLAIQTYIKPKVPSTIQLNILEPCSRCHVVEMSL
ncbi:hypothetical protein HU200_007282 [Digitaria exilis]|uniref:At1g61320/AtMIF1 LRR domain-containing protein n=1 Tax=Digitaria exilis TaxID=1010633 RepID=A0A835KPW0_9POAL|nr:hypothetical protein HU200_007282 [Digitaria exilis]